MNTTTIRSLFALLLLLVLPSTSSAQEKEANAIEIAGLNFEWDTSWKAKASPSMMSALNLMTVAEDQKEVLEAKFYYFKGGGGGVDANVKRWAGMFKDTPDQHEEELADGKVTLYTFKGTFMVGARGTEKVATPNYAMLVAIVSGEHGPVFVRMDGPVARLDALRDNFKEIVTTSFE